MNWFVYIIECSDGTLYTGVTIDLERRLKQHNAGTGAKYTKSRRPVKLAISFEAEDNSKACKEEYRIKQLSRLEKLALIKSFKNDK